jgi:HK97 family phage portal protein
VSLLRQLVEGRSWDPTVNPYAIPPPGAWAATWSGVPVSEETALRQLTVWSCVSLYADTVSQLPIGAFRTVGGFPNPVSPDPPIIQQPHAELDRVEWIGQLVVSALLRGNAYGLITERDQVGLPRQVMPVHPDKVVPRRNPNTGRIEYRIAGEREPLPAFDVMHVRGFTLPGSLTGLDPIAFARQTIGSALAAEEFGARFFGDGAYPSGILTTDDKKLNEDDAKRYQEMWLQAHGSRQRKPAVLGHNLRWEAISLKPEEAQFLETIKAKRSEIAGFFRVPPHLISDVERSTSWGTGMEEQNLMWLQLGLGIWIIRFERAISRLLPRPQYAKFNVAGLLRGRILDRYNAYLKGRQGGWLNVDDIRALEEMPPLPDGQGQEYNKPLNWGPLGPNDPGAEAEPKPAA